MGAYSGLGLALLDILGTSTAASGFGCAPTSPASMAVKLAPGRLYSLQDVDDVAYAALNTNTSYQITKQGCLYTTTTLGVSAPGSAGLSVNYLIEASFNTTDGNTEVIPYYNATNPAAGLSGPANDGVAQPLTRFDGVTLTAKAGIAAVTGSQTTPAVDTGYVPLYVVTIAFGQTTIVSANIAVAPNAPFLPTTLPKALSAPIADLRYLQLFGVTPAETAAAVTPLSLSFAPFSALRYGADPTGTNDSTIPLQNWINAAWGMYQFLDGQGQWNGSGGAAPVLILPPGKYRLTGTLYLPAGVTFMAMGHPTNTTNHTRLIMDSTDIKPGAVWAASTPIAYLHTRLPLTANGHYFRCQTAGTTGTTEPTWNITGGTTTDAGVTWQDMGVVGVNDNRNKPIIKFRRGLTPAVGTPTGATADSAIVSTIQWIEFGYVVPGAQFTSPYNGIGIGQGDYPLGACIAFDVDAADTRIIDNVFQASPCAIWMNGVGLTTAVRPDGFNGNRGLGIFIEHNEFDAAATHIWAQNCALTLIIKENQFFDSPTIFANCTGTIVITDSWFQGGSYIDAATTPNAFSAFTVKLCDVQPPGGLPWINLTTSKIVDISYNTLTTSTVNGGIVINNAVAGRVSSNVFNDNGQNASAGTGLTDFIASIKLLGCQNLSVTENNISATDIGSSTYNGFGILTGNSGTQTSQNNYVSGNVVTAPHAGASFNGIGRYINVSANDVLGANYVPAQGYIQIQGPTAKARVALAYAATITPDTGMYDIFDITVSSAAITIANPFQATFGQDMRITFMNTSGGAITPTWGAQFKVSAFSSPASGYNRSLTFEYDGTYWRQVGASGVDVPN